MAEQEKGNLKLGSDINDYPIGVFLVEPGRMQDGYVHHHWHEDVEFDVVKSGTAVYVIEDEEVEVHAGEGIFINRNVLHYIKGSDCVLFSIVFTIKGIVGGENSTQWKTYVEPITENENLKYYVFHTEDKQERAILSYMWDIVNVQISREFGMELTTQSCICQIWLLFVKINHLKVIPKDVVHKESNDMKRVKEAINYIQNNYSREIGLDEICESIAVSKSECCRCFKRTIGMSPVDYLINYRINIAAQFLHDSQGINVNIGELAINVGFNNASYFNRKFKEIMGCTPSEFKKKSKAEHRDFLSVNGRSISHI